MPRVMASSPAKDSGKPFSSRQVKKSLFDFDNWLESLDDEEDVGEARLTGLKCLLNESNDLLTHVDFALNLLDNSKCMYDQSLRKVKDVQEVAERLQQEQHALVVAREKMEESLSYFDSLPSLTRNLSSLPSKSMNEFLVPQMTRLDECIAFMESKPSYREASEYLVKYRNLQHSVLHEIKTHIVMRIKSLTNELMPPEGNDTLKEGDSVFSLFYARFQQACHPLKLLVSLLEDRLSFDPVYQEFLSECHEAFVECRKYLMFPVLTVALEDIKASHSMRNDCSLVKNSSKMVMHVVRDEHNLFYQVFSLSSVKLSEFLDELSKKLYDTLRPIVISLNPIETLAELCLLIREDILVFEENLTDDHPERLASFESVMEQLQGDIQLRLVHRTEIFIQQDIRGYKPYSGDLAYPEKLLIIQDFNEKNDQQDGHPKLQRSDSVLSIASNALSDISFVSTDRRYRDQKFILPTKPNDFHGMWYPTLRRTLLCLSKLYHTLDTPTFQTMSQEVVNACLESLDEASFLISEKKGKMDGLLFLLKHLLILREQITPFHIECTIREVNLDFDRVRSAAMDLLSPGRLFSLSSNNALLQFFLEDDRVPIHVKEEVFDPKKILDKKIRSICNIFITFATEFIASSVIKFSHLIKSIELTKTTSQQVVAGQAPQASPNQLSVEFVKAEVTGMKEQLKNQVVILKKSMKIYLSNPETEVILYRPVRGAVVALFNKVRTFINSNFSHPDLMVIQVPSSDEVYQLLTG